MTQPAYNLYLTTIATSMKLAIFIITILFAACSAYYVADCTQVLEVKCVDAIAAGMLTK